MPNKELSLNFIEFTQKLCSELGHEVEEKGRTRSGSRSKEMTKEVVKLVFKSDKEILQLERCVKKWINKCKKIDLSDLDEQAKQALIKTEKLLLEELDETAKELEEAVQSSDDSKSSTPEIERLEKSYAKIMDVWNDVNTMASSGFTRSAPPTEFPSKYFDSEIQPLKRQASMPNLPPHTFNSKQKDRKLDQSLPGMNRFAKTIEKGRGITVPLDAGLDHLIALEKRYLLQRKGPLPGEEKIADTLQYYGKCVDWSVMQLQMRLHQGEDVPYEEISRVQEETRLFSRLMKRVKKDLIPNESLAPESRYIPSLRAQAIELKKIASSFYWEKVPEEEVENDRLLINIRFHLMYGAEKGIPKREAKKIISEIRDQLLHPIPGDELGNIELVKTLIDALARDPKMHLWHSDPHLEQLMDRAVALFPALPNTFSSINDKILSMENTVMHVRHRWTTEPLSFAKRLEFDVRRVYDFVQRCLDWHEQGQIHLSNREFLRMVRSLVLLDHYVRSIIGVRKVLGLEKEKKAVKSLKKIKIRLKKKSALAAHREAGKIDRIRGMQELLERIAKNLKPEADSNPSADQFHLMAS